MITPKEQYNQRNNKFKEQAATLKARYERLSFIRLIVFLVAVGLTILLWSFHFAIGLAFIFLFVAGFYRFIQWHQSFKTQQTHCEYLALINRQEAAVLDHEYSFFQNGEEFINPDHPYTLDLDIFGPYSFFQYCNRTSTVIGRRKLANYLDTPADTPTIKKRQGAIRELKEHLEWRQNFQAYGMETRDELRHILLLNKWLSEPAFVQNNKWLKLALYLTPLWSLAGLLLFIFYLPWQAALLFLIPPALIIRQTIKRVNETHSHTAQAENILSQYARLINHIEDQSFSTPYLRDLQEAFKEESKKASQEIRRLSYIISQLNVRFNVFAVLLNIGGLWDLQWVYRLEKWKGRLHKRLPEWFYSLEEFEALSSLANLYYNNAEWFFPEIQEEPLITATEIGHPLISSQKRITNSIAIPTRGHIKLITGSNMAGKSTFLRTLGLNFVMAMCGAPVCARELKLPSLKVYTSMRTQDALHESTSSFYAELKRLKFIIEAVEKGENIFFLLDEILKGTNSKDRHTGSKALIRQLIKSKGSGLIATHDLELGQLEATANGAIENLCLEVQIKDGKLFFDYKLKKGVSQSFNATLLMKNMGIRIEES